MNSPHREAYLSYRRDIKKMSKRIEMASLEPSQTVLFLKMAAIESLGSESFANETFRCEQTGRFGFRESLVNRLMQVAYDYGTQDIEERSFQQGYEAANREIVEYLGYATD